MHSEQALSSKSEHVLHGALEHRVQSVVRTQPFVQAARHAVQTDGSSFISHALMQFPESGQIDQPPAHTSDSSI